MRHYRYVITIYQANESDEDIETFNIEHLDRDELSEVTAYLKERYANITPTRNANTGELVYRFRGSDVTHAPIVYWDEADFVSVAEVQEREVNPALYGFDNVEDGDYA
jgi:hypothetical protein